MLCFQSFLGLVLRRIVGNVFIQRLQTLFCYCCHILNVFKMYFNCFWTFVYIYAQNKAAILEESIIIILQKYSTFTHTHKLCLDRPSLIAYWFDGPHLLKRYVQLDVNFLCVITREILQPTQCQIIGKKFTVKSPVVIEKLQIFSGVYPQAAKCLPTRCILFFVLDIL